MNRGTKELIVFVLITLLVLGVVVLILVLIPDEEALKIAMPFNLLVGLGGLVATPKESSETELSTKYQSVALRGVTTTAQCELKTRR